MDTTLNAAFLRTDDLPEHVFELAIKIANEQQRKKKELAAIADLRTVIVRK